MRTVSGGRGLAAMLLILLATLGAAPAVAAQAAPLGGLDRYIETALREWEIPGLAIAVVHDDAVVHARGFGIREVGGSDRVDENTIFAIGSASKAFTAAAVGMLVDSGTVEWDDPATRHLPGFQLHDPFATRELTVRDLLSHRSGLSRGDYLWYGTEFDRDEILRRTRYLEPSWGFRSQFGYQNLMYLAAGMIIPSVTRQSWDDFVSDRIFRPLGMRRSTTSVVPLASMSNVATPHEEIDGEVRPIAYRNIDNIAPAGSINSSVSEMAQWVRLQLGRGEVDGRRLLSEDVVDQMHTPTTIIRREGPWSMMTPTSNFMAYGLGWFLNDHRGRKVVQHGGNIDGMHALVGFMPEEDVGLVILTNKNPNGLTYALMYRVFDAYLGAAPVDWSDSLKTQLDQMMAAGEEAAKEFEDERVAGTTPSLPLERYAGTYRHEMYGDLTVTFRDGRLMLQRGPALADLEHWHFDTFQVDWREDSMGETYVNFALDARGDVDRVELRGIGRFERVADDEQGGGR